MILIFMRRPHFLQRAHFKYWFSHLKLILRRKNKMRTKNWNTKHFYVSINSGSFFYLFSLLQSCQLRKINLELNLNGQKECSRMSFSFYNTRLFSIFAHFIGLKLQSYFYMQHRNQWGKVNLFFFCNFQILLPNSTNLTRIAKLNNNW